MKATGSVVRRTARRGAAVLCLAAALLAAPQLGAQTPTVKPVVVKAGQPEFTLTLESNRTTGFAWYLESLDTSLLEPTGHAYKAPSGGGGVGKPGAETWTFKARPGAFTVPRVTTVIFRYMRPWEPVAGQEEHFTVILEPGS